MKQDQFMRWFLITCGFLLLMPLRPALAHPHVWTDMTISVLFNDDGSVTGLRQTWLFDDFYTAYAVEGMDTDGDGQPDPDKLVEIMNENMKHLKNYGYFTEITSDGNILPIKPVTEMSTRMQDNRLEMTFVTALQEPVATDKDVAYAIFDPTYYVEMLHAETDKPILLEGAPENCRSSLKAPNPDPNAVAQAAMLDSSMRGETGLGQFFAERVSLICSSN